MANLAANVPNSATLRPVIVRACVLCGGKRQLDAPCADCGNEHPPVVHDLGVQAAAFADPVKQFIWNTVGQHRAARRAHRANRYVEK